MAKDKKQKNARKSLRMNCPQCGASQDSTRVQCGSCNKDLHPDLDSETLAKVGGDVAAWEEAFKMVQDPDKATPYQPIDQAVAIMKRLSHHRGFPGMAPFLKEAGLQLLPYEVALMKRTLNANLVLLGILIMFATLPLMIGWPLIIVGLMLLPVVGWGTITFKAYRQYSSAKSKLDALEGS